MKITPLREGLAEYLDEEQLYNLKKKLAVEMKVLKFLSLFKVSDSDCIAFARDEKGKYIFTEQSARFYAKKYAKTLYEEELIDIYLIKYDSSCGRGENIYSINENGLRLLGIDEELDIGLTDLERHLNLCQYVTCRKEELIKEKYKIIDIYNNGFSFHLKFCNKQDIFNEYIFIDDNNFCLKLSKFLQNHNPYNDTYTVLINDWTRSKELRNIINTEIHGVVLNDCYKLTHLRNGRNQKTLRPKLEIIGGYELC